MRASGEELYGSDGPLVLIVEDDRLLRLMALETLQSEGLPTIGAAEAAEGLRCLSRHPSIKLLITDINMPGMDGFELLKIVARQYPSVHLMAVSGRARLNGDGATGAISFLAKPFTASQLLTCVSRILVT